MTAIKNTQPTIVAQIAATLFIATLMLHQFTYDDAEGVIGASHVTPLF
jgi:hypothetical protein